MKDDVILNNLKKEKNALENKKNAIENSVNNIIAKYDLILNNLKNIDIRLNSNDTLLIQKLLKGNENIDGNIKNYINILNNKKNEIINGIDNKINNIENQIKKLLESQEEI